MAKITDPDSLSVDVNGTPTTEEVAILTGPKTLELRVAGNLDDTSPGKVSGVTGRALYSFLKEEWLNGTDSATLRRFKFPLKMIFEGSFIWTNGWAPANDQTRDLVRDAGFQEQVSGDIFACLISLGDVNADGDQSWYTQAAGWTAATTNFDKTGELNENIDITGLTTYQKSFLRIQGKTYAEYNLLSEQGLSAITYQAYSFPLANGTDLKINETDGNIDTIEPYISMEITYLKGSGFTTWANSTVYPAAAVVQSLTGRWFFTPAGGTSSGTDVGDDVGVTDWESYDGELQIGSAYYAFNRLVDCGTGTDQQAYNYLQRQLRQTGDINTDNPTTPSQGSYGTVNGAVAALLAAYVGEVLKPKPGVMLYNFATASTNSIVHQDITVDGGGLDSEDLPVTSTERPFPFVAAGNLEFGDNIVAELDAETYYTMYFEYITTTTSTGIAITSSAGQDCTIDYTSDAGALDHLANGDYIRISGFATNATNNDLYVATGDPSTNTIAVTKQGAAAPIDETAGDSVTVLENPFESPGAIIVDDNGGSPISGTVTAATIAFDFDYTNNNQGGRTPNTPAPVHIVAAALDGAEWVEASATITQATTIAIPINPNDERNYVNA